MNKTRFYQLIQSELKLLNEYLMKFEITLLPDMDGHNLGLLIKEIQQQIYCNEWNEKEKEIKKAIDVIDNKINILKNQLIVEVEKREGLKKLLNK